ncbi:MAG: hypothetical protein GY871_04870 [Actinomycetales bacterium]|nr:hypothetical protein [Actinomycetales bacterium]
MDFEAVLKHVVACLESGVGLTVANGLVEGHLEGVRASRTRGSEKPRGPARDPQESVGLMLRISELEDTTGFLAQQAVDDADQLVADAETTLKERRGLAEIRRAYQRALGAYRSEIPDN